MTRKQQTYAEEILQQQGFTLTLSSYEEIEVTITWGGATIFDGTWNEYEYETSQYDRPPAPGTVEYNRECEDAARRLVMENADINSMRLAAWIRTPREMRSKEPPRELIVK